MINLQALRNPIRLFLGGTILISCVSIAIAYFLTMELSVLAGFMLGGWAGMSGIVMIFYKKITA